MSQKFKKAVAIILASVLSLTSFVSGTSAADTEDVISSQDIQHVMNNEMGDLLVSLKTVPEDVGLSREEVENAYIGHPFFISNISDNGVCEEIQNIVYLPIISNQNIIAIATIHKDGNGFSCSVGKKFAEQLNEVIKAKGHIALIADGMDIIAIDMDNEYEYIIDYPDTDSNEMYSYALVCGSGNALSCDTILNVSYSLPETTVQMPRLYNYFSSYPIVFQDNYDICWAAVVASMVMFELPSQYPELYATAVCNKIGHSYTAGTTSDVSTALNAYLPSSYSIQYINRSLTKTEIKSEINAGDPACIFLIREGASIGHCVALCGYRETSTTFQVRYMDPYYRQFDFATYENSEFTFVFGNHEYEWIATTKI